MVSAKPRLLSDFASGGGGVWGGILRLLHPFLLAKFGADMPYVYYTARCNLMQLGIYYIYVIRKETWGKPKKITFEKEHVASRPCERFECR